MAYEAGEARGEEKFRLILGRIASIRLRLNALAVQHGLFGALTFILCAAVIVIASAFLFGALTFLLLAFVATLAALGAVVRITGGAWRMRASDERAARVADERAELKGRLTTMVGAAHGGVRSALWPYLVEDTLALSEEYVPSKVEPRRISRWLYALLASGAAAALVFYFAQGARQARLIARAKTARGEASADIGDLDIRPANPSPGGQGTQIDADPATLKKLAEKLRAAQNAQRNPAARLMADARDAASALQNKLTGGRPPALTPQRLKLTDKKGGGTSSGQANEQSRNQQRGDAGHGSGQAASKGSTAGGNLPGAATPNPGMPDLGGFASPGAPNEGKPGTTNTPSGRNSPNGPKQLAQNGPSDGGADHGSGSDPNSLFGKAQGQPLGNDTFKIPIQVSPSDQGFSATAPAYPQERVKSNLNASQYPDEPFERASIPASDRVTIKRVFER